MTSISYHGIREQRFTSKVTMSKPEKGASVADHFGLVSMTSSKRGVSISWGEVATRILEAAKVSPELRTDLLRELAKIDAPS